MTNRHRTCLYTSAVLLALASLLCFSVRSELNSRSAGAIGTGETAEQQLAANDESAEVMDRIARKDAIAAELILGNLELREAAAMFRDMYAGAERSLAVLRQRRPGLTDEEFFCRNVIDFVAARLGEGHEKNDVQNRLELQYQELTVPEAP